jgi:GT2 family glycosyltransferase
MNGPSVSVVIPALRGGRFLRQALASIARQDYQPLDIWVVDNGSSEDVRGAVAAHGQPVHLLVEKCRGAANARNLAIRQSEGDLVAFLDDDDVWTKGHLDRMVRMLEADPALDVAQGRIRNFRHLADGRPYYCSPVYQFTALSSAVYWRRVFLEVGLFDGSLMFGEDTDFWIRCWEKGIRKICAEPLSLLYYRHSGNMTANKNLLELGVVKVYKRRLDRKRQGLDVEALPATGFKEYLGEPPGTYDNGKYEEMDEETLSYLAMGE